MTWAVIGHQWVVALILGSGVSGLAWAPSLNRKVTSYSSAPITSAHDWQYATSGVTSSPERNTPRVAAGTEPCPSVQHVVISPARVFTVFLLLLALLGGPVFLLVLAFAVLDG